MTRMLTHAAVAVALYVASDALGRLGDRVAVRAARGARWPWAREA